MGFRFDSLQPQEKEAVAIWETLRRLGFHPASIGAGKAPDGQAMVNLQRGDGQIFTLVLGPFIDTSPKQFVGRWKEAVLSIYHDQCDPEAVQGLVRGSQVFQRTATLVEALVKRSFLDEDGNVITHANHKPNAEDIIINLKDLKS